MKLVIHPTAAVDIRIPTAIVAVSLRADGMYEVSISGSTEIEVFETIDPEIEVFETIDPEIEAMDDEIEGVERQYLLHRLMADCNVCEICDEQI